MITSSYMNLLYKAWLIPDRHPQNTDCFIVLSYALKNKKIPVRPTRELIIKSKELLNKFPGAKIIMSTGDNQFLGITNARVMANYATEIGISPKNILIEEKSNNTVENLKYSKQIMDKFGLKKPTLIILDLHARRAIAIAKKSGWHEICWISVYSRGEPAYGYKYLQTFSRLTIFLYEILAYVYGLIFQNISLQDKINEKKFR